jgi:hypothetical protein
MDQRTFDTLTLTPDIVGDDKFLLVDNLEIQIHTYNDKPIGLVFPPHVEISVASCEEGARGDTASGSVTKIARLETGMQIRVPLFVKEDEKIKVHTESRNFDEPKLLGDLRHVANDLRAPGLAAVVIIAWRRHRREHRGVLLIN